MGAIKALLKLQGFYFGLTQLRFSREAMHQPSQIREPR